jgi:tetratricopeptide (TPR) repeat protein
LTRQRIQLDAVIDVLSHADAELAATAPRAAGSLLPATRCEDPHVLAALPQPPADPAMRAAAEALRIKLAAGVALQLAGQPKRALAAITPLVATARALGDHALLGETQFALSQVQYEVGKAPMSYDTMIAAERDCELAGMDLLASEASSSIAYTAVYLRGDKRSAELWVDRARIELDRAGGSPLEESRLENALSMLSDNASDYDGAVHHVERAVELRRQVLGPSHPLTLSYMVNLVDLYTYDACRYDEAAKLSRQLAETIARDVHPENAHRLVALMTLAGDLIFMGRFEEAHHVIDEITPMVERTTGMTSDNGGALDELVLKVQFFEGHLDDALATADHMVELTRSAMGQSSNRYAYARQYRGQILEALGRHREALEMLDAADAKITENESDTTVGLVDGLQATAAAHIGLGEPSLAVPLLEHALAILDKHCAPPGTKGSVQFTLARALTALHQSPESARELATQARADLPAWRGWQVAAVDAWLREHPH